MKPTIVTSVLTGLILLGTLSAKPAIAGPEFISSPVLKERVAKRLQLSDAQKEQIKNLIENTRNARSAEINELKSLYTEWQALAKDSNASEAELLAIAKRQGELKATLKVDKLKVRKEIDLVLNEEQKQKLAAFKQKRKEKRKEKRKHKHMHKMHGDKG